MLFSNVDTLGAFMYSTVSIRINHMRFSIQDIAIGTVCINDYKEC